MLFQSFQALVEDIESSTIDENHSDVSLQILVTLFTVEDVTYEETLVVTLLNLP